MSHQSGRDVDISFFYSSNAQWYRRGTAENLDRARNWAFVRALIIETDVEMILVDQSILNLLREYAATQGEDPAWLEGIFRGAGGQRAILRHAPGHATHFHIRFYNPIAQETGRRAYQHLVAHGLVPPVQDYIRYKAKKGDTLGKIAKRFGTSIPALKKANALRKSLIREKQVYLIPVKNSRPRAARAPVLSAAPRCRRRKPLDRAAFLDRDCAELMSRPRPQKLALPSPCSRLSSSAATRARRLRASPSSSLRRSPRPIRS